MRATQAFNGLNENITKNLKNHLTVTVHLEVLYLISKTSYTELDKERNYFKI